MIRERLPQFFSVFGYNYKTSFVPLPFLNPLGRIEMGQMTLSEYSPAISRRHSYASEYSWPKRLFMLDRCFIYSRFELNGGKNQLIIFNTHNSAYDAGGKLREKEMPIIRDLMLEEYKKGNFVVAGGDWNQNPPGYQPSKIESDFVSVKRELMPQYLFPDNWQIVFDPRHPTNRSLNIPLNAAKTEGTLIDYYIVSPNIKVLEIKTLSQQFKFSDHEPVYLKIQLQKQ